MGIHDGHRARLRQSFLNNGLDSFNEVNALELLLFYALPRVDTNPIAHALLDRFENLDGVFSATEQELCQVPGIGKQAASLILLLPQMMKKVEVERCAERKVIRNHQDAADFFLPRLRNEKQEVFMALYLDGNNGIIRCEELSRGNVNTVEVNVRRLTTNALKYNCTSVVISHNHPDRVCQVSVEDDCLTKRVMDALRTVDVELFDHIVVAGDRTISYKRMGMLKTLEFFK